MNKHKESLMKSAAKEKGRLIPYVVQIVIVFLLFATLYFFWFNRQSVSAEQAVPADSTLVATIQRPVEFIQLLENSKAWKGLNETPTVNQIQNTFDQLKEIPNSAGIMSTIKSIFAKEVAVAVSDLGTDKQAFLLIADMGLTGSVIDTLNGTLDTATRVVTNITFRTSEYEAVSINTLTFLDTQLDLYYANHHNLLFASTDLAQIKKGINTIKGNMPAINTLEHYTAVKANIEKNTYLQLYVNTQQLQPMLIHSLDKKTRNTYAPFIKMITYAGLSFRIQNERIILYGYTLTNREHLPVEMRNILNQGVHTTQMGDYLPLDAASLISIKMDNYKAIWELTKSSTDKISGLVDTVTGYNIEEDLITWLGNEIAVANLPPEGHVKIPETVLMIKVKDNYTARQSMSKLRKGLENVTFSFKATQYKGFTILNGKLPPLLRLFFGSQLKDIGEPYFCIIKDYLFFSDSDKTIHYIIDAHVSRNNLANNEIYKIVKKGLPSKNNLQFYFEPEGLMMTIKPYLNRNGILLLNQLTPYISRLGGIGISLSNKNNGFEEVLCISIKDPAMNYVKTKWAFESSTGFEAPVQSFYDPSGDIVYTAVNENGVVYLLDSEGRTLPGWPRSISRRVKNAPAVGDMDGDNSPEIIITDNAQIHVFNMFGEYLPGWPRSFGIMDTAPVLTGSSSGMDLLIGTLQGAVYRIDGSGSVVPGWPVHLSGPVKTSVSWTANGSGNTAEAIYISTLNGYIYKLDAEGAIADGWPVETGVSLQAPIVIDDIDGDGSSEIILGSSSKDGLCYVYSSDGQILPGWPVSAGFHVTAPAAVVNLDKKGDKEMLFTTLGHKVYAFHADGSIMKGWPQTTRGKIETAPVFADITGNGSPDVFASSDDGKLYAWDNSGRRLDGFPVRGSTSPGVVARAKGVIGIVVGSWDRNVFYHELPEASSRYYEFMTYKGDHFNSGANSYDSINKTLNK